MESFISPSRVFNMQENEICKSSLVYFVCLVIHRKKGLFYLSTQLKFENAVTKFDAAALNSEMVFYPA